MKGQISSDAAANLYNLIQKQTRRVVDGVGYRVSGVVQPITLNLPAPLTNYKHLDIIVGITTDSYTTGYTNLYFGDDPTRFIQLRHPTRSDPNPYTKISIDILDNQTALVDGVMKDLGGASVIKFKSDVSGNPLIKFWVDAREV